jgi:hypothetical protein
MITAMITFLILSLAITLAFVAAAIYNVRYDRPLRRPPTSHRTDADFLPPARRG